ncbi:MAG: hypothetical protein JJU11_16755 [Candidatus Sumerlaeia bacterium]|nr:hypothetical protein [Candidatus Sumerlaeia bacterium]
MRWKTAPFKVLRPIIATLSILGIGVWLLGRYGELEKADEWAAAYQSQDSVRIGQATPPGDRAFVQRAVHRSEELFPPDRDGASEDLSSALKLAPFRSHTWFHQARNELFAGRREHARAAMARADELDPWYPGQRLRAIQFWYLLGERDRAVTLARTMAEMGPRLRRDAARELVAMGLSPRETWQLVVDERVPAEEAGKLLLAMDLPDPGGIRELLTILDRGYLEDHVYRDDLFRRATDPFLADVLLDVWEHGHGPLEGISSLPFENPRLSMPPFRVGLPVGWQPPARRDVYTVSWIAPDLVVEREVGGLLRMELPQGSSSATWRFYRTFTPGVQPPTAAISVRVRSTGTVPSQGWLTIRTATGTVRSPSLQLAGEWKTLRASLPEDAAGFLDLVLDIRPLEAPSQSSLVVDLGDLSVESVP